MRAEVICYEPHWTLRLFCAKLPMNRQTLRLNCASVLGRMWPIKTDDAT